MAASQTGYTLAKVADAQNVSIGGTLRLSAYDVTPTASSYYTTGYLILPTNIGLRKIYTAIITSQVPPSGTPLTGIIVPIWDVTNTALQLFSGGGGTPSGTIGAITPAGTVAVPTVKVVHSQGAGAALQILPKSVAGVLGSQDALDGVDDVIPGATFGIGAQAFTGTPVTPVFTGAAAGAAALSELASAADASAYVFRCIFIGN